MVFNAARTPHPKAGCKLSLHTIPLDKIFYCLKFLIVKHTAQTFLKVGVSDSQSSHQARGKLYGSHKRSTAL